MLQNRRTVCNNARFNSAASELLKKRNSVIKNDIEKAELFIIMTRKYLSAR